MLVMGDILAETSAHGALTAQLLFSGFLFDSDFSPIFDLIRSKASEGGLDSLGSLFDGHDPSVYASLLARAYPDG